MASRDIKLKELDLGFQSSIGAPVPVVLAGEHQVFLLFYLENREPFWDGTTVHVRDSKKDTGLGIISFNHCISHKLGMPNDEAIEGHPYEKYGLKPYSNFEVENSDWIAQLEKINSVHPYHKKERFERYKHYIFFFHDTNFECIAESFKAEKADISMKEAIKKFSAMLD